MHNHENNRLIGGEVFHSETRQLTAGDPHGNSNSAAPRSAAPDVYEMLGVCPIINAAGTITTLGGSLMPPEVVTAWQAASGHFVNLIELQDRIGERIAKLLNVEAALVTTGAAGSIVAGTSAAITWKDRSLIPQLPLPATTGIEVIRQKSHRDCYDHQMTSCGVKLVDVESREDLERSISSQTVMMFSYNFLEGESAIDRSAWIDTARRHGIPTLVDAAADIPPLSTISDLTNAGYDLVAVSGGKGLRGPQDTGLLLGRQKLIEAAKRNTAPYSGNIGRSMKVSKENMVALWAAIERFVSLDHVAEEREWNRRISVIEKKLADIPTVRVERITPPLANRIPHALIHWDESRVRTTPPEMSALLAAGKPSIVTARVHGTGDEGFLVSVFTLQPPQEEMVGERIRDVMKRTLVSA
ncbi:MAG: aminotransferase class V-fold PLP-dependent enzyme [Fuerstiella sp.]|nr:aminotransferase class V-fold PLP-dependent enzyme [Fuerstiella sp.]